MWATVRGVDMTWGHLEGCNLKPCVDRMERFGPFPMAIRRRGRFVSKGGTPSDVRFRKIMLAAVCVEGRLEAEEDELGVMDALVQRKNGICWPGLWQRSG